MLLYYSVANADSGRSNRTTTVQIPQSMFLQLGLENLKYREHCFNDGVTLSGLQLLGTQSGKLSHSSAVALLNQAIVERVANNHLSISDILAHADDKSIQVPRALLAMLSMLAQSTPAEINTHNILRMTCRGSSCAAINYEYSVYKTDQASAMRAHDAEMVKCHQRLPHPTITKYGKFGIVEALQLLATSKSAAADSAIIKPSVEAPMKKTNPYMFAILDTNNIMDVMTPEIRDICIKSGTFATGTYLEMLRPRLNRCVNNIVSSMNSSTCKVTAETVDRPESLVTHFIKPYEMQIIGLLRSEIIPLLTDLVSPLKVLGYSTYECDQKSPVSIIDIYTIGEGNTSYMKSMLESSIAFKYTIKEV